MNYQEQKKLIQQNIIPHLNGKIFVSEHAIYLSQVDTIKIINSLKNQLSEENYILYEELHGEYLGQVKKNYDDKNYSFNFSLMPYARRHGLVRQLKKSIN